MSTPRPIERLTPKENPERCVLCGEPAEVHLIAVVGRVCVECLGNQPEEDAHDDYAAALPIG